MFMLVSQGLIRLYVCMYVCMFLFFFVLCYYAILTRQFTVSFFCLVPVHSLSGLIWKQDSSHLLKIFKRILVFILYGKTIL